MLPNLYVNMIDMILTFARWNQYQRASYINGEKERMYLDMMHADFCIRTGYVGFVDVDTLFVTAVTQDVPFEDGKQIVAGRIGIPRIPCWIDTAEYILGLKQVVERMSYFPVVFKVNHIVEMRRYVEKLHDKTASSQDVWRTLMYNIASSRGRLHLI